MAFTLGAFMPKPMLKLPTLKAYPQQRKATIVCANPQRPKGSKGNGGKINSSENLAPLNSAQIAIKETDKNKTVTEDSSGKNKKSEASN